MLDGAGIRPLTAVWLVAAVLVLAFPARFWLSSGGRAMLGWPRTPTDHCNPGLAEQWRFLERSAALLPQGATYTVRGSDGDEEMTLHMMSLGVIRQARALPSSYYDRAVVGGTERAEYVLSYRGVVVAGPGLELVARVEDGLVLRRTGAESPG